MSKKILQTILKYLAKIALKRNNYTVVAITGSAGKTSTKRAVIDVLRKKYRVRYSQNPGYNTEIGLPLSILGETAPRFKIYWLYLIFRLPIISLFKRPYQVIVLEMGADKPGDIEYLTGIAKPDVAILTSILPTHLQEFQAIENVALEKNKIFSRLGEGDSAIFNSDSKYVSESAIPPSADKFSFGKKTNSEVVIVGQELKGNLSINTFKIKNQKIKISSSAVGEPILYVFAAAICAGLALDVSIEEIKRSLEEYRPVPGRLNLIEGLKQSLIIDDSYNANPESMKAAVDLLDTMKAKRKIAVLGNMNELGGFTEQAHRQVGEYTKGKIDVLVTVGENAEKFIKGEAMRAGLKKTHAFSFATSPEAGEFLSRFLRAGDVILLKGSQNGVRLELAVEKIMDHPEQAKKTFVPTGWPMGDYLVERYFFSRHNL